MRTEKPQTWEHIFLGFFKEGFFPLIAYESAA